MSGIVWRSKRCNYAFTATRGHLWFYAHGFGLGAWVPNWVRERIGGRPRFHLHHVRRRARWGALTITTPRRKIELPPAPAPLESRQDDER